MRMRKLLAVSLLVLTLFSCGCWDSRETDMLSIVTGLGVDAAQNETDIRVTVQIGKIVGTSGSGEGGNSFITKSAEEKTLSDCLYAIRHKNSRDLFLHHSHVLIFGQQEARRGISDTLDMLLRDNETRMEVWMVVAKSSAQKILEADVAQEENTALALSRMIEYEAGISTAMGVNFLQFVSRLLDPTTAPVALVADCVEEDEGQRLVLDGLAIFDQDKLVGFLTIPQAHSYAWVMGAVKRSNIYVETEYGKAVMTVNAPKPDMWIVLDEEGNVTVKLTLYPQLSIVEMSGFDGMNMEEKLDMLKPAALRAMDRAIRETFKITQRLQTDIYGIGTLTHQQHSRQWREQDMEENWKRIYGQSTLDMDIQLEISDTGIITDGLK